jgi:putative ABC transport system permease protein
MIRPRIYKVLSDLWGNKARSLLVIASITVGLFAVGLITSMYMILQDDLATGYLAINPANIQMNATPFDQELVNSIRRMESVSQAEGAYTLRLRVENAQGQWDSIEIKAIPDINQVAINQLQLLQGIWPPKDREIVVDNHKLADLGAQVGDTLMIELPSGKIRLLRLVGVVKDQSTGATSPGGFFLSPLQGYITLGTLPWLEQPEVFNKLYVTADREPNNPQFLRQLTDQINQKIEDSGGEVISTSVRASNDHPNRVYVQAIASVLFLLGFLVVFLSAFLITNTLSALLNYQVNQIGVMKTIGARRGQIMGIYIALIFIYGLIAFMIAQPLASRISYILLEFLTSKINMELQGYRTIPLASLLQLAIALIVPQIAGFFPILYGTRISAVEALSGYNQQKPPNQKSQFRGRMQNNHRMSRPLILSLRNTFRRKGRLALTLITLTLGGAILIGTFNVQRSLRSYIAQIGSYYRADVNLSLARNYRVTEIKQVLTNISGIQTIEGWAVAHGELVMPDGSIGESLNILAPPVDSPLVQPVLLKGRWLIPGDQNAITVNERFLELYPDLQTGDSLRVKINGEKLNLVVVGVFQISGKSGGYIAYATYEYLSELLHESNQASTYRITANSPGMTLGEQKALSKSIETKLKQLGISVTEVSAGQSLSAMTADGLNVLTAFLLIMASLIAIVGSISLTGTMSMNVMERTREIGIIRAIGASDQSVIKMVMVEGITIGLLSWFFGMLLSFPIGSLMSNAINISLFGAPAKFTYTPTGVLLWLAIVLVLSVLASVLPARSAASLTIREILAYE